MKNKRLNKNEKVKIKELTIAGKSLREVSQSTGFGITTIYYHTRKFKSKQIKEFLITLSEEKIGELMGAFAGDGSYYYSHHGRSGHHRVRYSLSLLKDKEYAEYLIGLLKKLNLNSFLFRKEKDNAIEVAVNSKKYIEFIREFLIWEGKKSYSVRLKNNFNTYNKKFLIGFARGLMDTDGFIEVSNVSCGCISERLIKNILDIFDAFGIKYKFSERIRNGRRNLFLVRVYRESLSDYAKIIGFSNRYKRERLQKIIKWNGVGRI